MNNSIILIIFLTVLASCKSEKRQGIKKEIKTETFLTDDFELIKVSDNSKAVLILFGGFGETPAEIKREFKILDIAKKNSVSVVLMNYSNKLWLEEKEKRDLAILLQGTLEKHYLSSNDIFIGGFSSGGIISLLISNFIVSMKEFHINPKGVFVVDSPIDLLGLYKASKKNIATNFSDISIQESNWLINTLEKKMGSPEKGIKKYEKYSVYTLESNYTKNLTSLQNTKIRFYTEPDIKWWKENRMVDFEQMNSYYIKKLSESLQKLDFKKVEYIPSENKGYRADGTRHPHSWSIIDKEDLIYWVLN